MGSVDRSTSLHDAPWSPKGYSDAVGRLTRSYGKKMAIPLRRFAETVSRKPRRFEDQGLIRMEERDVELVQPRQLRQLALCILRA